MKPNYIVLWFAGLLGFLFLGLTGLGLAYRINLFEIELNKYGGHNLAVREIQPIAKKAGKTIPGIAIEDVLKAEPGILAQGKTLYDANCASCHGPQGFGDGTAGATLDPAPRNFHVAEGWKNGAKLSGIYRTLSLGIPGTGMVAYEFLPPQDRFALAHYVRTYYPDPPADTREDLRQLDTEFALSSGRKEPNTVPRDVAADIVVRENTDFIVMVQKATNRLNEDNDPAAVLLRQQIQDPEKAVTVLLSSDQWTGSSDILARFIGADPHGKGFKSSINFLDQQSKRIIYRYALTLKRQ